MVQVISESNQKPNLVDAKAMIYAATNSTMQVLKVGIMNFHKQFPRIEERAMTQNPQDCSKLIMTRNKEEEETDISSMGHNSLLVDRRPSLGDSGSSIAKRTMVPTELRLL